MSVYLIKPSYTKEMLITIFAHLCCAEVRKLINFEFSARDGFQNGYVICLTDIFGSASEELNEQIFDAGNSYLNVIDNIVKFGLQKTIDSLRKEETEPSMNDLIMIDALVAGVVTQYVNDNLEEVTTAIKNL